MAALKCSARLEPWPKTIGQISAPSRNCSHGSPCSFDDPGPHGVGRYMEVKMLPEIQRGDWRKGAQVRRDLCSWFQRYVGLAC